VHIYPGSGKAEGGGTPDEKGKRVKKGEYQKGTVHREKRKDDFEEKRETQTTKAVGSKESGEGEKSDLSQAEERFFL